MAGSEQSCRVAAVVVTYNRMAMLRECLNALLTQTHPVDQILVIDNASTDGTSEMVSQHYAGSVIYDRLPENTGGAGGFHHGIKRAYERGFDWIWAMDDDAVPEPDCLAALFEKSDGAVPFLAPVVKHGRSGSYQLYHHKLRFDFDRIREHTLKDCDYEALSQITPLEANAFLGLLVRRTAISRHGLPDPEYFILYDDVDFTYRVTRGGTLGLLVANAIINHWDNSDVVPPMRTWKAYYHVRNRILFFGKYAGLRGHVRLALGTLRALVRYSLSTQFQLVARGAVDGYRGLWRGHECPG